MIEAALKDEAFLADVRHAQNQSGAFHVWWLGQAGFLVQWRNHHLLLDPYLSDSLTVKYAATDKPHVRISERVVDPAQLDFVDVASSSHNHTDHLDHETLWPLMRANPGLRLVIPEANRDFVANRLRCDAGWPLGCDDSATVQAGPFEFTGLASAHESLERDEYGRYKHLGYLVRFGGRAIYHSGDAVPYAGMAEKLRGLIGEGTLDLALLPINGRAPERRVPGNFFGDEAAQFAKAVGARTVIPMHYDMFAFNTASPESFSAEAQRVGQNYHILRGGERWDSD